MENQSLTPSEIKSLLDYRVHLTMKNVDISDFIIDDDMYVDYSDWVGELFSEINRAEWLDYVYTPEHARKIVDNPELIEQANWDEIVTLLTFIVRRERFSAGSFGMSIEDGTLLKVLDRLQMISGD